MDKLSWTERVTPLSTLKPYEKNPRKIDQNAFEKLKESLAQDGYHTRLIVTPSGVVVGGHMRLKALLELGYTDVPCLVTNRELTEDEFKRINIRDNLPYGEWDWDALANQFEAQELIDIGMPEDWLPDTKGDSADETKEPKAPIVCPNCGHVLGSEEKE